MDRRTFVKLAATGPAFAALDPSRRTTSPSPGARAAAPDPGGRAVPLVTSDRPVPAADSQASFTFYSELSEEWHAGGRYFDWTSTTPTNRGRTVSVFYRTFGSRSNPALVMLHGYPTSSFDFREVIPHLENDYFVAVLDFPGFGFSDKPQDGYSYMLEDDARLVHHFVREVLDLRRFHLLTHDRGGSVGFSFLGDYLQTADPGYEITYHFISNGGLFLPLANLLDSQTRILHPEEGPELIREMREEPRLTEGDPVRVAYADIEAFNDGIGARLHVGKYLLERAANEYRWLDNLRVSPIPTALIWGLTDPVNPVRIADHIWLEYLNHRAVESTYWLLPTAGHYPQRDEPEEMAWIVRTCLERGIPTPEEENAFMWELARERAEPSAPVYVGRSIIENVQFPGAVEYSRDGYDY